jgi:Family of unknown function (DUF6390)
MTALCPLPDRSPELAATTPADGSRSSGALAFARFAFRPNALGYCGGQAPGELFDRVLASADDPDLHRLCGEFAGARPYLELLAQAPGAQGPLDAQVVEAYWVGGPLLEALDPIVFRANLERRVRPRASAEDWRWLAGKPAQGAVPHHAFHVLEIYPRLGLTGDGSRDAILATMERCLVRPARVTAREGDELLVMARPLVVEDGVLRFGEERQERILATIDGRGFVDGARSGDIVAVHWGWACDVLGPQRGAALEAAIAAAVNRAAATT